MDDQREVIAFLSEGASYGRPAAAVERIETHISIVFLVADRAYKLKRAVRFSYVDYSTPALREKHCRAELALNRRTAPALYLCVRAITRGPGGNLAFDGDGAVLDWVVEMRRFSERDLFDRLAEAHKLTPDLMRDLADAVAGFHGAAEIAPGGGRAGIAETIAANRHNLLRSCPPLDPQEVEKLHAAWTAALSAVGGLLDVRRDEGKVRRCHGDLHLRNICLLDGRPTPFDCIEFSDRLACIDVLYDLAFLLMDLVRRGLNGLASIVFNRYLDLTADLDGLPALPLFMSMRAAVRALVAATLARQNGADRAAREAQAYLAIAGALLRPHPPCLIAIGGRSGVGKSTLAQALAPDLPPAPGARVVRSDVLRKRLFDVAPEVRLPPSAYETAVTERVYRGLHEQALTSLAAGYTVIVDAAFLREDERRHIAACAARAGVPFVGLWLEAPSDVLAARIGARRRDASDADVEVLRRQLAVDPGPIAWHRIDATQGLAASLATARGLIAAALEDRR